METLTADEFKKRYGVVATSEFGTEDRQSGLFQEIKDAFSGGMQKVGQGIQQIGSPGGQVPGVGKVAGGIAESVTAPAAPLLNRTIGKAVNFVADKISNIPGVQKFAMSRAGQKTAETAETFANYGEAAGLATGVKGAKAILPKAGEAVKGVAGKLPPGPDLSSATKYTTGAIRDVIPTKQSLIDHNIARALDLTPGDLSNIAKSTGNEVGQWMAENNLIGTNKGNTLGLIKNFFSDNYKFVRENIDAVQKVYVPSKVPRFTGTLTALAVETEGKLGLEAVSKQINSLLKKDSIRLADVQAVKELLDEHYSLYKATGDVQQGVAKQGLANVRMQLKDFIENEVATNTGADIRGMNNNVATAKSLADAIETRSPRGLTRANVTFRDFALGAGLTYFATPVVGLAAVLIKKVMTSPTIRLRFARYLDSLDDAQRAKISASLKVGEVPAEVKKAVGGLEETEPYTPASDMPTIQMGQKPKDTLPTIKY